MRHKYETHGIVLARSPLGEANAFVTLITPELGLIRARAQGVRRSGAKLAAALTTFALSEVVLVRGREGWRLAGALLTENWFVRLEQAAVRERAARVSELLVRLVAGEAQNPALFAVMHGFFTVLSECPDEAHESAEVLAALRILATLGLDAGEIPGEAADFTPSTLAEIRAARTGYIARINRGIEASGL
ncbi:DNA repair protein RecO [Candidatus Kaiserbacteria bacterium RIFCSPLOWO2_02_FULL_55_12]|uniref:DNA repair protein RecO n=2 Tax=Candidatus Kaiseribacteriota TaxID=1752734 RepID=A0A1F6F0P3_9BACT|nr:MAG: repair protein RecO protein [Parcubacteria group bacterium GW2011_GWA2_56_21]OGG65058.1 MAG: DNA repair protein RecO [Candidatus Kaiserbacteria bacterium RIFCSPHIGHO2_02_FULL_55_17]OGG79433.1 MAG: DNA repair protein RecO [Candidatus Kaiserbacteria bacterium RIFCSPLOWO2_02_FULL_55_12]